MDDVRVKPIAVSARQLALLLGLSAPASYAMVKRLGPVGIPGTKKGMRVLLSKVREAMGDDVADAMCAALTGSILPSAGPIVAGSKVSVRRRGRGRRGPSERSEAARCVESQGSPGATSPEETAT